MAVVSLQQMLSRPSIQGVFNRTSSAPLFFQELLRARPTDTPTVNFGDQRTGFYDTWRHTLTSAQLRAPKVGPNRIPFKPTGTAQVTVARIYESTPYDYGDIFGLRGYGTGELDARGQQIVARQNLYLAARVRNAVEFMLANMFRKGFSIVQGEEGFTLGALGAGTVDVSYPIPAANVDTIATVSGVTGDWGTSSTKVKDQLLAINARAEMLTGLPIRHLIMNSKTYGKLEALTQLATLRGTALPVFSDFMGTQVDSNTGRRSSGFTVFFPAMPQFLIHVFDGVYTTTQLDPSTRTTGTTTKYIPDDRVIAIPEIDPGGWHGHATCQEPIRKDKYSKGYEMVSGMDSFSWPIDEPPGEELRVLLNYVPVLFNPDAVYYLTVA